MTIENREKAVELIRVAFARHATEPYGDLALNAERAAAIAVQALVYADEPDPDCGHEWHGADGGPCPWCGWDPYKLTEGAS